jgi:hypothetical protein
MEFKATFNNIFRKAVVFWWRKHEYPDKPTDCKLIDWLIDYCFTPSKQYFSYFQDENKTNNIYNPEGTVVVVIV